MCFYQNNPKQNLIQVGFRIRLTFLSGKLNSSPFQPKSSAVSKIKKHRPIGKDLGKNRTDQ